MEGLSSKQLEELVVEEVLEGSVEAMESGELVVNTEVAMQEVEGSKEVKESSEGCEESGSTKRPAPAPISPSPRQKSRKKKQSAETSEDDEKEDSSGSEEDLLTQEEEASVMEGRGADLLGPAAALGDGVRFADLSLKNGGSQSD